MASIAVDEQLDTRVASFEPEQKPRSVLGWAALGVVGVGIFLYTFGGWILSGDAHSVSPGTSKVPTYMTVFAWIEQPLSLIGAVLILYFFLLRPWRRQGHVTQDGLFILAFMVIPWVDSCVDFFQNWFAYSSAYINLGGWDRWVPGWMAPHGNLVAEPIVWDLPFYVWGGFGMMAVGCWFLRKVKTRRPSLTIFQMLLVAFFFGFVFDSVVEPLVWILPGAWTWPGAISWLTLFHGHYYQFPIYEGVLSGLWWAALACFRYFQNDKGQTIAERGIERVRVSTKRKAWVRWLAMVGVLNLITFGTYNLPMSILGLYSSPFPKDILDRSYFMDGLCGPGTSYACPGTNVPIPRRDSAHLDPAGNLIVPTKSCWPQECAGTQAK